MYHFSFRQTPSSYHCISKQLAYVILNTVIIGMAYRRAPTWERQSQLVTSAIVGAYLRS